MAQRAHELVGKSINEQLGKMNDFVHEIVGGAGGKRRKAWDKFKNIESKQDIMDLLQEEDLVVFFPFSWDRTHSHAVAYHNGLLFDATQSHPLKLCSESLDFLGGSRFRGIYWARLYQFQKPKNDTKNNKRRRRRKRKKKGTTEELNVDHSLL